MSLARFVVNVWNGDNTLGNDYGFMTSFELALALRGFFFCLAFLSFLSVLPALLPFISPIFIFCMKRYQTSSHLSRTGVSRN